MQGEGKLLTDPLIKLFLGMFSCFFVPRATSLFTVCYLFHHFVWHVLVGHGCGSFVYAGLLRCSDTGLLPRGILKSSATVFVS
jgi:hypothetical protein